MRKHIIKIILTILILLSAAFEWTDIYKFKFEDGIAHCKTFYEQPENSIDVMCFGSSLAYVNLNTACFWKEYGIASFDFCGSVEPMWNIYYHMKEALKYQTPKVMIVDVYTATFDLDYFDDSNIIKNSYGLKLSNDKMESVKVSSPKKLWNQYLLEYPTYHARYESLTIKDYSGHETNGGYKISHAWKGMYTYWFTVEQAFADNSGYNERLDLLPKNKEYLVKIIDLAESEGINLIFVSSPHEMKEIEAGRYNTIADIAAEHNIPFLNCNLNADEIGINSATDYIDKHHMNAGGSEKYTNYIADFLIANYDIPDHRGESLYTSYDEMLREYECMGENYELSQCKNAVSYINKIYGTERYFAMIAASGSISDSLDDFMCEHMGYDMSPDPIWIVKNGQVSVRSQGKEEFDWDKNIDGYTFYVSKKAVKQIDGSNQIINEANDELLRIRNGMPVLEEEEKDSGIYATSLYFNKTYSNKCTDGLNIVVYDTYVKGLVDVIGINNDLEIVR